MPIRVTCPNCAKSFNTADANLGKRARCGGCQTIIVISAETVTGTEPEPEPYAMAEPAAPPRPQVLDDFAEEEEAAEPIFPPKPGPRFATEPPARSHRAEAMPGVPPLTMPPEPWYYRYLVIYALVLAGIAAFQFLIVTGFLLYMMVAAERSPLVSAGTVFIALLFPFLYSLAVLLFVLVVTATILLAVDAARNLRVVRYRAT